MTELYLENFGPRAGEAAPEPRLEAAIDAMLAAKQPGDIVYHAREALALNPACVEGLYMLAAHVGTEAERVALLKEAVRHGRDLFEPSGYEGVRWQGKDGAWLFMLSLSRLGRSLINVGDQEGAKECFTLLADFDPEDRLETREFLILSSDLPSMTPN